MRVRLFSLLSACALFVFAAVPAGATSDSHDYLALGDSVAFGYSPLLVAGGQAGNASVFVGYPDIAAKTFGMSLTNASCPGETTAGMISRTPSNDFVCLPYVSNFPLHVSYSGSQLDFAVHYLQTHPTTRLVTIDIGANDVFKLEAACGGQATQCFANGLAAVLQSIDANLRAIFNAIRNVAHYHHALVALTYYSLSYDAPSAAGTEALNAPIIDATKASGGIVASGFDAFKGPSLATPDLSSCEAGLRIVLSAAPLTCDVHPSPAGRDLLAAAIVSAVADSCPAHSFNGCLDRNQV